MKTNLFERLCQPTLLQEAWNIVKSKNATGGIDGLSIKDFEAKSDRYMAEILKDLKSGNWTPYPYMAVSIPKNGNERRNIGLLSIKDVYILRFGHNGGFRALGVVRFFCPLFLQMAMPINRNSKQQQ